jgi:hypothetical protein
MISKRIRELQKLCKERGQNPKVTHFDKDYNYAALHIFNELNHTQKLQKSMAYALPNMDVFAYEGDAIGGRIYYTREEAVLEKSEELDYILPVYKKLKDIVSNFDEVIDNQLISMLFNGDYLSCNGHIAWRYDYILSLGVDGLREKYIKALENPKDEIAKEFY